MTSGGGLSAAKSGSRSLIKALTGQCNEMDANNKFSIMNKPLENIKSINDPGLAIVIPTLNEAKGIEIVLDEISELFSKWGKIDVIVVDGHSEDGTDFIARNKGAQVLYQRDKGYGDALRIGFRHVKNNLKTKIIVMMDADSTYNAGDIPTLIEPILQDEADLVLGNRFSGIQKGSMSLVNSLGNRLISWFARRTLKIKVHDTQSGFRAFRSELVDRFELEADGMPLAVEMLVEAKSIGARICEVPISYGNRVGTTKLDRFRDGFKIFETIVRLMRDTQPLAFFGTISAILGLIGLTLGIEVTLEWISTGTVGRLPTVMLSVLLMVGAVQFFSIGLVADMIKNLKRKR